MGLAAALIYFGAGAGEALFSSVVGVVFLTGFHWIMWGTLYVTDYVARFVGLE